MSPISASTMRHDRATGLTASFFLHMALFICGSLALIKPVEYAVEAGSGGIEVSLTAAPMEPFLENQVALPQPEIIQKEEEGEREEKKEIQTAADSLYKGDGSSPIPGTDPTTFYSAGGAMTEAKPNYLKNPAPEYPLEARQKGWEGLVIFKVLVDPSGRPLKLEKEKSSGYEILDRSALRTIKTWRFRPAQIGALPVESSVRIPIRFELEQREIDRN